MHDLTRYLADSITIRRAGPSDAAALNRVAALDSSKPPAAPVVLALAGGEVRAALSLADGAIVADPFHETAAIVELLEAWAWHEVKRRDAGLGHRLRRAFSRRRTAVRATEARA